MRNTYLVYKKSYILYIRYIIYMYKISYIAYDILLSIHALGIHVCDIGCNMSYIIKEVSNIGHKIFILHVRQLIFKYLV